MTDDNISDGEETDLTPTHYITNCCEHIYINYRPDGWYYSFSMAKIDGLWYERGDYGPFDKKYKAEDAAYLHVVAEAEDE